MRIPRFALVCVSATALALAYVWQQTEIFRLAYVGQKQLGHFEELLDVNSALRYNLTRKTSVSHMGLQAAQGSEFHLPEQFCLLRVPGEQTVRSGRQQVEDKMTLIARMFGFRRQAEAQTLNQGAGYFSLSE